MNGRTHVLTGMTAWLGIVPLLADHGLRMTPAQIATGAVVCGGAALLPDLDHPDGTVAGTFGPVTRALCGTVSVLAGGHRHATHSLLFCAGAALGADWLSRHLVRGWWVLLFLLIGLGLRGIGVRVPGREHFDGLLIAVLAGGLTYLMAGPQAARPGIDLHGHPLGWAGLAVGIGGLVHVITDCLTPDGAPLLWPLQLRIGIPLIPRTDGPVERWVVTPLLALGVVVLGVRSPAGSFAAHWLERPGG